MWFAISPPPFRGLVRGMDLGDTVRMSESSNLSGILERVREGCDGAREELWERVHGEVRALAAGQLAREGPGVSLAATGLANEAWLRLAKGEPLDFESRAHFFGVVAVVVRRILVERARKRDARPRRVGAEVLAALEADGAEDEVDFAALDAALAKLEQDPAHERKARVVALRFFAGRSVAETAELLGVAEPTVKRDWRVARAFLFSELSSDD